MCSNPIGSESRAELREEGREVGNNMGMAWFFARREISATRTTKWDTIGLAQNPDKHSPTAPLSHPGTATPK